MPVNKAGLASLVGTLLETGTTTRNSMQLSDAYAALGAEHGGQVLVVLVGPGKHPVKDPFSGHRAHEVGADVIELDRVKERSGDAELRQPQRLGEGLGNFMTFGEFPTAQMNDLDKLTIPRGAILNRDLSTIHEVDLHDPAHSLIFERWRWAALDGSSPTPSTPSVQT